METKIISDGTPIVEVSRKGINVAWSSGEPKFIPWTHIEDVHPRYKNNYLFYYRDPALFLIFELGGGVGVKSKFSMDKVRQIYRLIPKLSEQNKKNRRAKIEEDYSDLISDYRGLIMLRDISSVLLFLIINILALFLLPEITVDGEPLGIGSTIIAGLSISSVVAAGNIMFFYLLVGKWCEGRYQTLLLRSEMFNEYLLRTRVGQIELNKTSYEECSRNTKRMAGVVFLVFGIFLIIISPFAMYDAIHDPLSSPHQPIYLLFGGVMLLVLGRSLLEATKSKKE